MIRFYPNYISQSTHTPALPCLLQCLSKNEVINFRSHFQGDAGTSHVPAAFFPLRGISLFQSPAFLFDTAFLTPFLQECGYVIEDVPQKTHILHISIWVDIGNAEYGARDGVYTISPCWRITFRGLFEYYVYSVFAKRFFWGTLSILLLFPLCYYVTMLPM